MFSFTGVSIGRNIIPSLHIPAPFSSSRLYVPPYHTMTSRTENTCAMAHGFFLGAARYSPDYWQGVNEGARAGRRARTAPCAGTSVQTGVCPTSRWHRVHYLLDLHTPRLRSVTRRGGGSTTASKRARCRETPAGWNPFGPHGTGFMR